MNDIDTKFNRGGRNNDEIGNEGLRKSELEICRPLGYTIGQGVPLYLTSEEHDQVHLYVLHNCDELVRFVEEHKLELGRGNPRLVERRHKAEFAKLIRDRVSKLHEAGHVNDDLYHLVSYPSRLVRRYSGYIVNGFRFHTHDRSQNRKTQNCGVMVRGHDSSDTEYYGVLKEIYEMHYPGGNRVFVFKCDWFDVQYHGRGYKVDEYGFISVNNTRSLKTDEVFVLQSQVEQVFYIQDPKHKDWNFVVKVQPRDLYNMLNKESDEVVDVDAIQQVNVDVEDNILRNAQVDYDVPNLATDDVRVEKEASVVNLVKQAVTKKKKKAKDVEFINDSEIVVCGSSSEEEDIDYVSAEESN